MQVSIELTMSPLQDDFEQHIIKFIKVLRSSEFTVLENPLSTQIFGEFTRLMPFLTQAMNESMARAGRGTDLHENRQIKPQRLRTPFLVWN